MSISDDPELMREIMVDHYKFPRCRKETDDPGYTTVHMDSASCIDDVYIHVRVKDGRIDDICWHGTGCAISCASCSVMSELLNGKTVDEALTIADNFDQLMRQEPCDEDILEEADAFANVPREPARINCARIGWKGLRKALGQEVRR